jgi:chromate transporter
MSLLVSRRVGFASLAAFLLLLIGLPVFRSLGASQGVALFDAFYRSSALVFGGGHVALPLLRDAFVAPGWVSDNSFLAGYGAAQTVPGPLFTFAAYLGAAPYVNPPAPTIVHPPISVTNSVRDLRTFSGRFTILEQTCRRNVWRALLCQFTNLGTLYVLRFIAPIRQRAVDQTQVATWFTAW